MTSAVSEEEVEQLFDRLNEEAEAGGYHLNPDKSLTVMLLEGMITNIKRYGYPLCPCRLTGGSRDADLDIICPCDYRDPDLDAFDTCF